MGFFYYTLLTLLIIVALLLVMLILIQKGRGGGLSGAFGGGGGSAAFGAKTGDVLTWLTSSFFAVFIILAVALDLVVNHQYKLTTPLPPKTPVALTTPAGSSTPANNPSADVPLPLPETTTGQPTTPATTTSSPTTAPTSAPDTHGSFNSGSGVNPNALLKAATQTVGDMKAATTKP